MSQDVSSQRKSIDFSAESFYDISTMNAYRLLSVPVSIPYHLHDILANCLSALNNLNKFSSTLTSVPIRFQFVHHLLSSRSVTLSAALTTSFVNWPKCYLLLFWSVGAMDIR